MHWRICSKDTGDTGVQFLTAIDGRLKTNFRSQGHAFCKSDTLTVILVMLTGGTSVVFVMLHVPHMCLCNHNDGPSLCVALWSLHNGGDAAGADSRWLKYP